MRKLIINFLLNKIIWIFEILSNPNYWPVPVFLYMFMFSLAYGEKFFSVNYFVSYLVPLGILAFGAMLIIFPIVLFNLLTWEDYLREWFS